MNSEAKQPTLENPFPELPHTSGFLSRPFDATLVRYTGPGKESWEQEGRTALDRALLYKMLGISLSMDIADHLEWDEPELSTFFRQLARSTRAVGILLTKEDKRSPKDKETLQLFRRYVDQQIALQALDETEW